MNKYLEFIYINMRKTITIYCVFFLLLFCTPVYASDETWINEQLKANSGSTYTLPAGNYVISGQITIPTGTILQGEVSNGKLLSKITLGDYANLGKQVPLVSLRSNCKIMYINFDGNSKKQDVPTYRGIMAGNGYHNFIGANGIKNIEVAHCNFYNNLGDDLRANYCDGVSFHDNTASEGGHDVLFTIKSSNIEAYNNIIKTKINSALRAMDCSHVKWHDNYIYAGGDSAGLGMQIQHDSGMMEDIEVYNNVIVGSYGPGLWCVGKTGGGEELYLHHNLFLECGYNTNLYWVGGIVASGYDNIRIQNNVFDGCYLGGMTFWDYSRGSWSTEATAYIDSNIFINSIPGKYSGSGGYGINNEISKQYVVSTNNCYWNNRAGDTRGCTVSGSDMFTDPRTVLTPSGWAWVGSEWQCDGKQQTTKIAGYKTISYSDDDKQKTASNLIVTIKNGTEYTQLNTTVSRLYAVNSTSNCFGELRSYS